MSSSMPGCWTGKGGTLVFPCHIPQRFHVAETTLGPKTLHAARKEYVVTASVVCSTRSPTVQEMNRKDFQQQYPRRIRVQTNASGAHQATTPQAKTAALCVNSWSRFQYHVCGFRSTSAAAKSTGGLGMLPGCG